MERHKQRWERIRRQIDDVDFSCLPYAKAEALRAGDNERLMKVLLMEYADGLALDAPLYIRTRHALGDTVTSVANEIARVNVLPNGNVVQGGPVWHAFNSLALATRVAYLVLLGWGPFGARTQAIWGAKTLDAMPTTPAPASLRVWEDYVMRRCPHRYAECAVKKKKVPTTPLSFKRTFDALARRGLATVDRSARVRVGQASIVLIPGH